MNDLKRILLVEDDPKDVELTLTGLAEYNLANEVVIARDGEEASGSAGARATDKHDPPAVPGGGGGRRRRRRQWLGWPD